MGATDSEIEDIIEDSLYNRAGNEAYAELLQRKSVKRITVEGLDASITKQTKKYAKFFRAKRLGGFDKILVAKQMYNILSDKDCKEETVGSKMIENFGKLFEIINEKLR